MHFRPFEIARITRADERKIHVTTSYVGAARETIVAPVPGHGCEGVVELRSTRACLTCRFPDARWLRAAGGGSVRYAFAVSIAQLSVSYLRLLPEGVRLGISVIWVGAFLASLLLMWHFAKARPGRSPVDVQIDADGILVDRKLVMRRRHIGWGATHTATNGEIRVVFLKRRSLATILGGTPALVFFATDSTVAHAMLAAAGVDARPQVLRATFLLPQAAWSLLVFAALGVCLARISWPLFGSLDSPAVLWAPFFIAAMLAFGMHTLAARTTVSVGSDGVEIRQAFRRRFLPLGQVRDVKVEREALKIALTSGECVTLARTVPFAAAGAALGASDIGVERALGERIIEALRAHRMRRPDGSGSVALGRDSRSVDAWFAFLRAVGKGASSYRTGLIPVDELRRFVSDAGAPTDVRVGAAVALRIAEGTVGVEPIRIAAAATAATELRAVLHDIADGAEEAEEDDCQRHLSRIVRSIGPEPRRS